MPPVRTIRKFRIVAAWNNSSSIFPGEEPGGGNNATTDNVVLQSLQTSIGPSIFTGDSIGIMSAVVRHLEEFAVDSCYANQNCVALHNTRQGERHELQQQIPSPGTPRPQQAAR